MWAVLIAGLTAVSALTIRQHDTKQNCLDLQCPSTAFDYGVRNLINEEWVRSEECKSCQQCTDNGYSICMTQKSSRASRTQGTSCSCTHSVPANCHNRPTSSREQPANITMSAYHICYLSALQAPPVPMIHNEPHAVVVEVDPFFKEQYWRDLEVDNLTLHYDYIVEVPEHCDGEVITTEEPRVEHLCVNSLKMNLHADDSEKADTNKEDDYEHSEDYESYDDELPPDVQIDRDVFAGAKLLTVYYEVEVRRPRQLATSGGSDPFRDIVTPIKSELVKWDLKPEVYGTAASDKKEEALPEEKDEPKMKPEAEDVSEEPGDGTDFFEDDKKETESEQKEEKEDEELEEKAEQEDEKEEEETTTAAAKEKEEDDKEEEKADEKTEDKDEDKEDEEEEETTTKAAEHDDEKEEEDKEENEETADDDKADDEEEDTEKSSKEEDGEKDAVEEEVHDDAEKDGDEDAEVDDDVEQEGSGDEETEDEGYLSRLFKDERKMRMVQYVFSATLIFCLIIIIAVCCFRRGCCGGGSKSKTTSNGYRYTNPNRTNDLVSPPEKERLHQ